MVEKTSQKLQIFEAAYPLWWEEYNRPEQRGVLVKVYPEGDQFSDTPRITFFSQPLKDDILGERQELLGSVEFVNEEDFRQASIGIELLSKAMYRNTQRLFTRQS